MRHTLKGCEVSLVRDALYAKMNSHLHSASRVTDPIWADHHRKIADQCKDLFNAMMEG